MWRVPDRVSSCATGRVAASPAARARIARASGHVLAVVRPPHVAEAVELAQEHAPAQVGSSPLAWSASSSCRTAKSVYRAAASPSWRAMLAAVEEERRDRRVGARARAERACCRPPRAPAPAARRRPPALAARRPARWPWPPVFRPCAARPSSHSVDSECVVQSRSTRSPAQASGTVAVTRNQNVAHCGPSCSPSSTGRYSSCRAASRPMRSVGPAMRIASTARRSRCASPARRRAVCRRRSRV